MRSMVVLLILIAAASFVFLPPFSPTSVAAENSRVNMELMAAVDDGDLSAIKAALDTGATPDGPEPPALLSAVLAKRYTVAKFLLDSGADPNHATIAGFTSLHAAASNHDPRMISLLLDYGARPDCLVMKQSAIDLVLNTEYSDGEEFRRSLDLLFSSRPLRPSLRAAKLALRAGFQRVESFFTPSAGPLTKAPFAKIR